MNRVGIVTDSCASIPHYLAAELHIEIVPYHLIRDGQDLRDGIEAQAESFAEYLAALSADAKLPITTSPTVYEYAQAFRGLAERTNQIVALTGEEGDAQHACAAAAAQVRSVLPELVIEIVDAKQIGMALGWIGIEAARTAAKHATLAQVVERAQSAAKNTFTMQTSSPQEYAHLLDNARERIEKGRRVHVAFVHCGAAEQAEILRDLYFRQFNCIEEMITPLSPALAVHSGHGTVGACFFVE